MQQHVDPCREPEIRIDFETEETRFGPSAAAVALLQDLPEHCPGSDGQVVALFLPESEECLPHAVPGGDQEGPGPRRRVDDSRWPLPVAGPVLRDRGKPGRPHEEIRDVPMGEELPLGLLVPGSHDAFEEVAQEVHLSVPGSDRGEVVRFQPLDGETDLRIGAAPGPAEAFSGHLLLGTVESGLQADPIHLVEPGQDLAHLLFGRDLETEAVAGRRGLFVLDLGEKQSRQEVEDLGVGLPAAAPEHIVQLGAQRAQLRGGRGPLQVLVAAPNPWRFRGPTVVRRDRVVPERLAGLLPLPMRPVLTAVDRRDVHDSSARGIGMNAAARQVPRRGIEEPVQAEQPRLESGLPPGAVPVGRPALDQAVHGLRAVRPPQDHEVGVLLAPAPTVDSVLQPDLRRPVSQVVDEVHRDQRPDGLFGASPRRFASAPDRLVVTDIAIAEPNDAVRSLRDARPEGREECVPGSRSGRRRGAGGESHRFGGRVPEIVCAGAGGEPAGEGARTKFILGRPQDRT